MDAAIHSPLLELPFEIRSQIYSYLLPTTDSHPSKGLVWRRGTIAILATNSQIYQETSTLLYGHNTFSINIEWDSITFKYQWILPSGLVPTRTMKFPDDFAARNVALMTRFRVSVHHIHSYTGMVKYNYGGPGLTDGLRSRVVDICRVLKGAEELMRLEVELRDEHGDPERGRTLLEPFLRLDNVRRLIMTGGSTIISAPSSNDR